jgi:hypothetical protein
VVRAVNGDGANNIETVDHAEPSLIGAPVELAAHEITGDLLDGIPGLEHSQMPMHELDTVRDLRRSGRGAKQDYGSGDADEGDVPCQWVIRSGAGRYATTNGCPN